MEKKKPRHRVGAQGVAETTILGCWGDEGFAVSITIIYSTRV